MASKTTAPLNNLPPFQMATFLRAAEQRYETAQTSHKFELWQRVRAFSFDAMRELHNFHDAMRRRVPTLRCAECVGYAVHASEARAVQRARQELAGLDLSMVWSALWTICQEVATYVGGGAVLGGVVGGVGGAFFGGVGAVPGAIGGASVGAEIGGWLLGLIGIKCLVEYISKAIPEMAAEYGKAFAHAWRAGERDPAHALDVASDMHCATEAFANGHLLLVTAILSAIVLYLSRGVLGRAQLYGELARSRLGPAFARWVEANEATLLKHPKLQPVKRAPAAGDPVARVPTPKGGEGRVVDPVSEASGKDGSLPSTKVAKDDVAAVVAARRTLAEDFYRRQGFSEDSIKEHVKGINFEKPVEEVTLKQGTELVQYQVPGGRQGNYYAYPGTEPEALGIAAQAQDRTGAIVDKIGTSYRVAKDVTALRSTSASIKDTWSIPGREIQTPGGKTQFFTAEKDAFVPL